MTKARDLGDNAQNTKPKVINAKGDLIVGTGSDAADRLAVSDNGSTLVADSSATTGLRWQGLQSAGKNKIINGAFDIWQRGTSSTTNADYGAADRWYQIRTTGTVTWSRSTDVPTNAGFVYSMSMAGTSINEPQIRQRIESNDAAVLAGQTVTLSFWAKSTAGTNLTLFWYTQYPNATDNWSGTSNDQNGTVTITTSWARYSITTTANALATRGFGILLGRNGNETSTTLITGVQLELGSVATPFTRAGGTLAGELAACQRYYQRIGAKNGQTVGINATYGYGFITSSTGANFTVNFPVTMRTTPTSIEWSSLLAYDSTLALFTPSAVAIVSGQSGLDAGNIQLTITGAVAARPAVLIQNSTSGYLAFNAEL